MGKDIPYRHRLNLKRVAILSGKVNFRAKKVRDRNPLLSDKRINPLGRPILNAYIPGNKASKYME